MTVNDWLKQAANTLKVAGIGSARLDALILLEDETGRDRAWILAHPETILREPSSQRLNKKVARRIKHEPLAYIRGYTEFYGRKFKVNKRVLEPRPESETMIELLKQLVDSGQLTVSSQIADIGTGSGALAITAKLEFPKLGVIATDIDPNCLKVARQNAKLCGVRIKFIQGNLLDPLCNPSPVTCNLVLANLPYVPEHWKINEAAAMEPRIAIFGGKDGLDIYRRLFEQLSGFTRLNFEKNLAGKPKYIFTESLPPQHKKLAKIAKQSGYKLHESQDFIQLYIRG